MDNYIRNSTLFQNLTLSKTFTKVERLGSLPFCEIVPKLKLHGISKKLPFQCNYFKNMVTSKGLCFSFNSLGMDKIFKSSPIVEEWKSTFGTLSSSDGEYLIN